MSHAVVEGKKVLIVDDEPSIRVFYERELRGEGYELIFACDGTEAVRLAREERPDVVVLDIRLPGMDGIQSMHRILEERNDLAVIINTAYSSYRDNFMSWAAEAYLIKSSDLTELKATIRGSLEKGQGV